MKYRRYDAADFLHTPADVADYVALARASGDQQLLQVALKNAARATARITRRRQAIATLLGRLMPPRPNGLDEIRLSC